MSTTTLVRLNDYEHAIDELKFYLQFCSIPTEFDPWTNVVQLHLDGLSIGLRLIALMVEFVNLPFAKDPTGDCDEEIRWINVTFDGCDFTRDEEEEVMSTGTAHDWFCALVDRTRCFKFTNSPELVSDFLDAPDIEHRAVQRLHIEQEESLSTRKYATLGNMMAWNNVQLRELYLHLPLGEGAQLLLFSLEDAINLQELSLHDTDSSENTQAGIIAGGIGPLIQLLRNPQNQLKKLCLPNLGLHDQHLIALSELLPTCQIEFFDVSENMIQSAGMMEFVRHLPRMHSLKHIRWGSNRWQGSENACNTVGNALLQHVTENPYLESIDKLDGIPQAPLLGYYLVVNRAGRRLLTSSHPVPDGLWSCVLERAIDETRYTDVDIGGNVTIQGASIARYNAIYFLLQNFL